MYYVVKIYKVNFARFFLAFPFFPPIILANFIYLNVTAFSLLSGEN